MIPKASIARFAGWAQFVGASLLIVIHSRGLPKTFFEWLLLLVSFGAAVGIDHASETDGTR